MGGKVVLAARREELLREITQEIRESGGEASYIKTDVRVKDQVNAMGRSSPWTPTDALMCWSMMPAQCRLPITANTQLAMEAWEQSIATAINGTLYGIAAVYDQMIEQGQGHIVNISSILGNYPVSGCGVYNVTKAAVRMLGDSLRVESRGKNQSYQHQAHIRGKYGSGLYRSRL